MTVETLTWLAIAVCIIQSAMFSGLNLAVFGISRLRLEIEAASRNRDAIKVLRLRRDPNYLLTTILWGNVGINVLLALLSNSLLTGVSAFLFSTVVITLVGEIAPQAYFSRNALRMGALLAPVLRFYQILLFPVAKSTALLLDWWLGPEGGQHLHEKGMRELIKSHIKSQESDVDRIEGIGALNFLAIDDLMVAEEGEPLHPQSVVKLPHLNGKTQFPSFDRQVKDDFLQQVQTSGKKWVVIVDEQGDPRSVLDADGFLRDALFFANAVQPESYCHRPLVVHNFSARLGDVISQLGVQPERPEDDVIDKDIVLVWGKEPRIITGADILGRLLRGITKVQKA